MRRLLVALVAAGSCLAPAASAWASPATAPSPGSPSSPVSPSSRGSAPAGSEGLAVAGPPGPVTVGSRGASSRLWLEDTGRAPLPVSVAAFAVRPRAGGRAELVPFGAKGSYSPFRGEVEPSTLVLQPGKLTAVVVRILPAQGLVAPSTYLLGWQVRALRGVGAPAVYPAADAVVELRVPGPEARRVVASFRYRSLAVGTGSGSDRLVVGDLGPASARVWGTLQVGAEATRIPTTLVLPGLSRSIPVRIPGVGWAPWRVVQASATVMWRESPTRTSSVAASARTLELNPWWGAGLAALVALGAAWLLARRQIATASPARPATSKAST